MPTLTLPTPGGPAQAEIIPAASRRVATLMLGHGAGGGTDARDLQALAAALPGRGVTVVLVSQPWRVAGRRVAGNPASLDKAWIAVAEQLRAAGELAGPVIAGGRSAGARVACRTAQAIDAAGCLALSFPLHPPGKPERSRVDELIAAGVPTLVVQGARDSFGGPAEFPAEAELVPIPDADHSFKVPARSSLGAEQALGLIVTAVAEWLQRGWG